METDYVCWIVNSPLSDLSPQERVMRYFVRCTNLFGKMSLGRNQISLKFLLESPQLQLDYRHILDVMKEKTLPYLVRARYFTLMKKLFVDRDPQTHKPQISYTRVWSQVQPEQSDLDMSQKSEATQIPVCTNGFQDLQACLLEELPLLADCKDELGRPSLNSKALLGQLELIKAQVALVDEMIEFGFFVDKNKPDDLSNLGNLLKGLFAILDTRQKGRTRSSAFDARSMENTLRNELRSDALNTVLRIFNMRLDKVTRSTPDPTLFGLP